MRFTCVAIGRKRLFQKSKWQTREKVGQERLERSGNSRSIAEAYAEQMLQTAEQGFKENYALLKKLSEM